MREARLTTETLAEAKVEDFNKAKEDSKEDFTTKAEDSTTMEEVDSKAEDSATKVADLEGAEATSIQMISNSNIHLVLLVTAAQSQLTKQDSSQIGTITTHETHVRIRTLINIAQTKGGTDNCQLMGKLSHQIQVQLLNSCWSNANSV